MLSPHLCLFDGTVVAGLHDRNDHNSCLNGLLRVFWGAYKIPSIHVNLDNTVQARRCVPTFGFQLELNLAIVTCVLPL